ncbi:uncharacterized protein C5orf34 homolog isoform 2-T2 [Menidia menidia]
MAVFAGASELVNREKCENTMETSGVSLMIMYEDESVDVRYRNGSQLQLSPCGCEFFLVRAADPHGHPLQPAARVRQRTRFTVSTYKELMVEALAFRNKYASRPYLPQELIPSDKMKPFFSMDPGVQWPEPSSCEAELGPGGETVVRSENERAVFMLSPSGEEFSVEFTCSLSQPPNQQRLSSDPSGQQQPEKKYQSTTVVQHHSCHAAAHMWAYPLSLAQHHQTSHHSINKEVEKNQTGISSQADVRANMADVSCVERRLQLPQALPLTCPSPHWHRWKFKDPLAREDISDLPTDLVKIIWCKGIIYRILKATAPIIEISPGDGSVIRSNGALNSYFTHYKPKLLTEQVNELCYHVNSLPADVPGQAYSLCSVISRASRILACYNQANQLMTFPSTPTCLQKENHFSKPELFPSSAMPAEQHVHVTQTADCRSDLVASELSKIKRFNFLLENNHLLGSKSQHVDLETCSAVTNEPINEDSIAEALQRTSRAIQDIDAVISATTLT